MTDLDTIVMTVFAVHHSPTMPMIKSKCRPWMGSMLWFATSSLTSKLPFPLLFAEQWKMLSGVLVLVHRILNIGDQIWFKAYKYPSNK